MEPESTLFFVGLALGLGSIAASGLVAWQSLRGRQIRLQLLENEAQAMIIQIASGAREEKARAAIHKR